MKWRTHTGQTLELHEMQDTHLANIIHYLDYYGRDTHGRIQIEEEIVSRGLTDEFMAAAPYPFRDRDGSLRIWDYGQGWNVPYEPGSALELAVAELQLAAGSLHPIRR